MEEYYDLLMADDGRALLMRPLLNYSDGTLDPVHDMLTHPTDRWGLGDGGAHCGTTCDASMPTFMLTHWARDRTEGRIPLEEVVRTMTSDTADLVGLGDRGRLVPGHGRRRQPDRPREPAPSTGPGWSTTSPATPSASCSGPPAGGPP